MNLGAFSISLNVKNITLSKDFYEKLGFSVFGGDIVQNWLIMRNENCIIGLFQGMFNENIMTFNPGWNMDAKILENFTDIREIQKLLKLKGINILNEIDDNTKGPNSFMVKDPDGNTILLDQHV